jgi:hypothetical protein
MSEQEKSFKEVFQPIVEEIVEESIEAKMIRLSQDDIETIINLIMPKIDEIIAKRVRGHIHLLLDAVKEKIKE